MADKLSDFQISHIKSAMKGFCYDANPSTWPDKSDRKQMESLVKMGLMYKAKNHSGDKHGFYALTEKGKIWLTKQ